MRKYLSFLLIMLSVGAMGQRAARPAPPTDPLEQLELTLQNWKAEEHNAYLGHNARLERATTPEAKEKELEDWRATRAAYKKEYWTAPNQTKLNGMRPIKVGKVKVSTDPDTDALITKALDPNAEVWDVERALRKLRKVRK